MITVNLVQEVDKSSSFSFKYAVSPKVITTVERRGFWGVVPFLQGDGKINVENIMIERTPT